MSMTKHLLFQSTHSLRSATAWTLTYFNFFIVSIHALLAECDCRRECHETSRNRFNPRTPCGVRPTTITIERKNKMFQSTHSLRSATVISTNLCPLRYRFNPRTPCGVRLKIFVIHVYKSSFQSTHSLRSATVLNPPLYSWSDVSIHALLAECDLSDSRTWPRPCVSIHALLAECDKLKYPFIFGSTGFNPRTPCGVRPFFCFAYNSFMMFQSTHSLRSATRT